MAGQAGKAGKVTGVSPQRFWPANNKTCTFTRVSACSDPPHLTQSSKQTLKGHLISEETGTPKDQVTFFKPTEIKRNIIPLRKFNHETMRRVQSVVFKASLWREKTPRFTEIDWNLKDGTGMQGDWMQGENRKLSSTEA